MAQALDGKSLARRLQGDLRTEVQRLQEAGHRPPCLAVILVGADPASTIYVTRKAQACRRVGIESMEHHLGADTTQEELLALVHRLNKDPAVDGVLVQLPLPRHMDKRTVLKSVLPRKDVDAFHPESVGHVLLGDERMAPCTPQGILLLLDDAGIHLAGAEVVIVNHSEIVGRPLAAMCIARGATVTVCHSQTRDVAYHTRHADIVVTGTGGARPLTAQDIREGAVVVDVSMNRSEDGTLSGDAEPAVWNQAAWVTPVPGGVGPMTIFVLLQNTLRSYRRALGLTASPPAPRLS